MSDVSSRDLAPGVVLVFVADAVRVDPKVVATDRTKVIKARKADDSGWWMTDGSGLADYVWDRGSGWCTVPRLLADLAALRSQVAALSSASESRVDGGGNVSGWTA